jgi:molecular chaperone GrpE
MSKIKKPAGQKDTEKNQELENSLKRALADYQNLERRVEEERRLLTNLSSAVLIEKFLPVLDNLESAQMHLKDEGLEMVIKQFKDILKEEGVEEIEAQGRPFDPNLHEATEVIEGKNDNKIVKILRKGYKINDKVIRPAQVSVERNSQQVNKEEQINV